MPHFESDAPELDPVAEADLATHAATVTGVHGVPAFTTGADDGKGLLWGNGGWQKSATPLVTSDQLDAKADLAGAAFTGPVSVTSGAEKLSLGAAASAAVSLVKSAGNLFMYATDGATQAFTFQVNGAPTLKFGADANLYRSAADTLKTDDDFQVGNVLTVRKDDTQNPGRPWLRGNSSYLVLNSNTGGTLYLNQDVGSSVFLTQSKYQFGSAGAVFAPNSTTTVPLVVKLAAGQTADGFQVQDSAGAAKLAATADGTVKWGNMQAGPVTAVGSGPDLRFSGMDRLRFGPSFGIRIDSTNPKIESGGNGLSLIASGLFQVNSAPQGYLQTNGNNVRVFEWGTGLSPIADTLLRAYDATHSVAVQMQAAATADAFQIRDNANVVLSRFNAAGQLGLADSLTPVTPTSGGVLFVTSGALRFKGSGGTDTLLAPA